MIRFRSALLLIGLLAMGGSTNAQTPAPGNQPDGSPITHSAPAEIAPAVSIPLSNKDQSTKEPDFIFGTNLHHVIESEPDILWTIGQSGITCIRDEVSWKDCEKERGAIKVPGDYVKYIQNVLGQGLSPLEILDYSNDFYDGGNYPKSPEAIEAFAKYCEAVVSTFKGKIKYYQVWNEWDGGCGMDKSFQGQGDMESYIKLLSVVYPRIKAIDPSVIVIANSICSGDVVLEKTVDLGVLKHCDAVSLHTYNFQYPVPEDQMDIWYARMQGVDKFLREANGGREVPLYLTEMGWPTQVGAMGSTEEVSADCLGRLYLLAFTMPYIQGVWWYNFCDNGWDSQFNEDNFGLVRHDLTPKRAYFVMKDIARLLKDARFVARLDAHDPKIFLLKFKRDDGKWLVAAWSNWKDIDWQISFANSPQANSTFNLTLLGGGSEKRAFHTTDKEPTPRYSLDIRNRPLVLEGDLENITLTGITKREFPESNRR